MRRVRVQVRFTELGEKIKFGFGPNMTLFNRTIKHYKLKLFFFVLEIKIMRLIGLINTFIKFVNYLDISS